MSARPWSRFALCVLVLFVPVAGTAREEKKTEAAPAEETVDAYDSKTKGAIQVKGDEKTGDWFLVQKDGKSIAAPRLLNGTEPVSPGTYEVDVNKTKRTVKVEAGKKVVLVTGTLVVEGKKANFYFPQQGKEQKVASNYPTLNHPIALFAGTYDVYLSVGVSETVSLTKGTKVEPGKKTTLKE